VIGITVNIGGIILLTRIIGPQHYGFYAAAIGIFIYLFKVSLLGINVYLIRTTEAEDQRYFHLAFTFLIITACIVTVLTILAIPMIQALIKIDEVGPVLTVLAFSLPVILTNQVPLAVLERSIQYKKVAFGELGGQVGFYAAAIPAAIAGAGMWAPVTGWWIQQFILSVMYYKNSRYRPRFYWNSELIKKMLGYGVGYSSSVWIWHLRQLVNPVIVGRFIGADAVGIVAVSVKIVESLGFIKESIWRISISAFAQVQNDIQRLKNAVSEGMHIQLISVGVLLVIVAIVLPFVAEPLMGAQWKNIGLIFPFIALGYLAGSLYSLHSSALYVLHKNNVVSFYHFIHILLFVTSALFLVPRYGLIGYGYAEICALGSFAVQELLFRKYIGKIQYSLITLWSAVLILSLFVHTLGWIVLSGLIIIVLVPSSRNMLRGYATSAGTVLFQNKNS